MHRALKRLTLILCLSAACTAGVSKAAAAAGAIRPTGPVTVTADRAEFEKGGAMLYTGNVLLVSDTLKLSGDRLELRQFEGGQYQAKVAGAPARLEHAGETSALGETTPPVSAQSNNLHYDSRTSVVEISGKAQLMRDKDEISGESIRYNVQARRIEAVGGESGQVKIVIQPPPEKKTPENKP